MNKNQTWRKARAREFILEAEPKPCQRQLTYDTIVLQFVYMTAVDL